jgi:hypothetical protein
MDDLAIGCDRSERGFGGRTPHHRLGSFAVDPLDRGDLGARTRQRRCAGRERQNAVARARTRAVPEPEPDGGGRHVINEIALDEQLLRWPGTHQGGERQVVQLGVGGDEQAPFAREQAARLHWPDQLAIEMPEGRSPGPTGGSLLRTRQLRASEIHLSGQCVVAQLEIQARHRIPGDHEDESGRIAHQVFEQRLVLPEGCHDRSRRDGFSADQTGIGWIGRSDLQQQLAIILLQLGQFRIGSSSRVAQGRRLLCGLAVSGLHR